MSDEPLDVEVVDESPAHDEHVATTAALVPVNVQHSPIVRPVATTAATIEAFREYQEIRDKILRPEDYQEVWGAGKKFVTKSGWRKLATMMGVSAEIVVRDNERDAQGRIIRTETIVRAIAPNGRYVDGLGACDYRERCCPGAFDEQCTNKSKKHTHCTPECRGFSHFSKPQHDIPATAATRALNRACSDLFGFGEVSAEEVAERVPAAEHDVEWIVASLNAIPDGMLRKQAKAWFVDRFGMPNEVHADQVATIRAEFAQAGYMIVDPSAPDRTGTDKVDQPDAETGGENTIGQMVTSTAPSASGDQSPPSDDTATSPVEDGGAGPEPPGPPAETAPAPTPSSKNQRQRIAMLVNDLVATGRLHDGDKAVMTAAISGGRATSTTEITYDEAVKYTALLRYMDQGRVTMIDDAAGGRSLQAEDPGTERFFDEILALTAQAS